MARTRQASAGADIAVPARLRADEVVFLLPRLDARVLQGRVGEFRVEVRDGLVGIDDGLEGRRDLFLVEEVPVDRGEEGVVFQFIRPTGRAESVHRVTVEQLIVSLRDSSMRIDATHALDELLAVVTDHCCQLYAARFSIRTMLWEPDFAVANQAVHLLSLLGVEWTPSTAHLEEQDTEGPEIDVFAVTFLVQQDFRGKVPACETNVLNKSVSSLGRSAEGVGELVVGKIRLRQAEIAERNVTGRVEQDVLRLQISARQLCSDTVSSNKSTDR